jgi:protein arginine kinase
MNANAPGTQVRALAERMTAWLDGSGPESAVVLSSRVRLARNLRGVPFPQRASDVDRSSVFTSVSKAAGEIEMLRSLRIWNVDELQARERNLLVERHLVSPNLLHGDGARGLMVRDDERLGIMVNEEDHLRLQSVASGLDLDAALAGAVELDRELEGRLPFATSRERGYLTACPTNVGTGMRASVLLHLPALVLVGEVKKVHRAVGELGMTVRGWFGEGSAALGDYYQLSNQKTLGKTEPESCQELLRVTRRVIALETEARAKLRDSAETMRRLEDRVGRSWGILKFARLLNVEQVMAAASDLRLGRSLGLAPSVSDRTLNRVLLFCQPAHLEERLGGSWSGDEESWMRAQWIRDEVEGQDAPGSG